MKAGSPCSIACAGRFFVTTGEVLIPEFTVNGQPSGSTVVLKPKEPAEVRFRLSWTFPLRYVELISGDGTHVFRDRIDLADTGPFDERSHDPQDRPDGPDVGAPRGLGRRDRRRIYAAGLAVGDSVVNGRLESP